MNIERFLPYGRQSISETDKKYITDILGNDFITQGPTIKEFEEAFAKYVNAKYAIACSNGTAALHLACRALGLSDGDKLVTSVVTFLASANCAQFQNADTILVDIDPETFCISIDELERVLKLQKIDVVIPVHMAGHPADMNSIYELKQKYGFKIIEDSCHALGGEYQGSKIGSCKYSSLSTFSFHPVKHITTGEGGAITTNDKKLYDKISRFRTHGIHKNNEEFINEKLAFDENGEPNLWYYEMPELGYNYRITDIQCALGLSQLKNIESFVNRRREIAHHYNQGFQDNPLIRIPLEQKNIKHSYHLYTIQINFQKLKKSRNRVMKELRDLKIGSQVLYIPIHLQPYYAKKYGYKFGDYPLAEIYYSNCLSIPMFPDLKDIEIKYIIEKVNSVIST